MTDPVTPTKNLVLPTVGSDDNIWGSFLNSNFSLVDQALGGTLAITIAGNLTLTSIQVQNTGFTFTGSLSVQATITFPSYYGFAVVSNQTTQPLVIGYASGLKSTVAIGETTVLWADGANILRLSQAIISFPLAVGSGGTGASLSATGGAHQVLKQSTIGGAITVGQLASSDISGLAASATTDTTNATNITSGTLSNARLVSVPNTALQNSTFVISGHTVSLGSSLSLVPGDVSGLAASATTDTTNATNITSGTLPTGRISGAYAGLSGVGTITSGLWQGNAVDITHGGTAASNATSAFANLIVGSTVAIANGGTGSTSALGAFANLVASASIAGSGFLDFQNGLILQWGQFALSNTTTTNTINFSVAFPHGVFVVIPALAISANSSFSWGLGTVNIGGFELNTEFNTSTSGYFIAIGN